MRKGTLPVSSPADPAEREASSMARKIMRAAIPGAAEGGELAPMRPKESLTPPVARLNETGAGEDGAAAADPAIIEGLGSGFPMDPGTRAFFEQRFGADLSQVRLHNDAQADRAARSVRARAFTFGKDIAFASGEYDPASPGGRELLAHELVHVLQNGDGIGRMIMRDGPGLAGTAETEHIVLDVPLGLPRNKGRHAFRYQALARSQALKRPKNYNREELPTDQVRQWNAGITFDAEAVRRAGRVEGEADPGTAVLHIPGASGETSRLSELLPPEGLLDGLKIPAWNKAGRRLTDANDRYDVDHIVERQVGGSDDFGNYELFRAANNRSVGSALRASISQTVLQFLQNKATAANVGAEFKARYPATTTGAKRLKDEKEIRFAEVADSGRDSSNTARQEGTGTFWTRDEIARLVHVSSLLLPPDLTSDGTATRFALYSPSGMLRIGLLPHAGARNGTARITIAGTNSRLISGLVLSRADLTYGGADQGPSGSMTASWDLDPRVFKPGTVPTEPLQIALSPVAGKQHAASFAWPATNLTAAVNAASPIALTGIMVSNGRLDGQGMISPTLPFLEGVQLPARLDGRGLRMAYTIDATSLVQRLNLPRLRVDEAGLTLFIDESGPGAEGFAAFTVEGLGGGVLFAGIAASGKFELSGSFTFDPTLFDEASVALRYSDEGFSATGRIGITQPGKIRGLRSASAQVSYDTSAGFVVEGTAQPEIPGIASATLRYTNSPEGQRIEGMAVLDQMPGLRGGQIGLRLQKQETGWKLAASGQIAPDIPGVTSSLEASYDDGAFTVGGTVAFQRGPFSGTLELGATNRPLGPEGQILDGAPGTEMRAFGAGQLTARLTDNLQGSVGIRRRPSGQILISGRIGIPQSVELFGRYPNPPWERVLLSLPTVNIPIFGGGVGSFTVGIAATIGGALTASAHVGPGMLEQASIGIDDFDPTDMNTLQVTGSARFVVPAYAGLRLGIDAGITGGAAIISVTGGMSVGAELGIAARAEAEAELLWTPTAGLSLQATLSASAEPRLRFTVGAFVKADVSLLITSFTIYRKDWQLAAFEYGPALRVGMAVPIAWRSGSGVDFDFNAIRFQLPSISPQEMIGGLLSSQGNQQTRDPDR